MTFITLSVFLLPAAIWCLGAHAITPEELRLRKRNDKHYLQEFWIFLGSVLVFFTLANFLNKFYRALSSWNRARALAAQTTKHDAEKAAPTTDITSDPSQLSRIFASISAAFKIITFRWSLWMGPVNLGSIGELTFILGYLAANFTWLLVDTQNLDPNFYKARAGMIATAQMPLVISLANKNSIISFLTGVSHEKLNILHRASGRTIFIFLWIHVIGRVVTGLPPHVNFKDYYMQAGIAGIAAVTAGTFLSMRIFRQAIFEFFFFAHVAFMAIFTVTAFVHVYPLGYGHYVWPAFILWGLDRAIRLARLLSKNIWQCNALDITEATVELLTLDFVRLSMRRKLKWKPGQHAYICIPKISRLPFEFHPFTISTIPECLDGTCPEEKEIVFLIRARDGMTRRLEKYIRSHGSGSLKVYMDGPYGTPPSLHCFSSVILVAGGSGISYTLPLLLDIVRRSSTGVTSDVRRVKFIWIIRGEGHLPWINKILAEALGMVKRPLAVDACIYVTGTGIPQEPKKSFALGPDSEKDIVYEEPEVTESFSAKIYHGRPGIRKLFNEEITFARGPIFVDTAGPLGLTEEVKQALSTDSATAGSALKGAQSVTLHVETFGMAPS